MNPVQTSIFDNKSYNDELQEELEDEDDEE